jgi:hypothetical protein
MRLFENITSGYRKIASGIAIVAFLALLYFALIPAGTIAASFVATASGDPIIGAIIKLVDYPQYNTTSGAGGVYSLNNVPYNGTPEGSTYLVSASATGFATNVSFIKINSSNSVYNFTLTPGGLVGEYRYYSLSANGQSAKKLAIQSTSGKSFIVPQYGDNSFWKTTVYITDMSGLANSVEVKYYDMSGNNPTTETIPIPSNGVISFVPSDNTALRPTTGKLVITSTQNITGTYTISSLNPSDKTLVTQSFYSPSEAATQLIIPQYGDKSFWGTFVSVSDVTGSGATLNIEYYNMAGSIVHSETRTLPANGMVQWFPTSIAEAPATGKIIIRSTGGSVIGEYRIYKLSGTGQSSNKVFTSRDYNTQFIIPQYGDKAFWGTFVSVSDVSGSGATLLINYYNSAGTLVYTEKQIISANGMVQWFPTSIAQAPATGKIEITSTANVIGEYRIYALDNYDQTQNSLFTSKDQATSFVVPYYGNNVDMGTFIAVSDNTGAGATLTVRYYTLGGVNLQTTTKTVPPNGMIQWFPHTGDGIGAPSEGKVVISS